MQPPGTLDLTDTSLPAALRERLENWSRAVDAYVRAITSVDSPDILPQQLPGGTALRLHGSPLPVRSAVGLQFPFQIYRYIPDPAHPADSDWRTIRVRPGFVHDSAWLDPNGSHVILPAGYSYLLYFSVPVSYIWSSGVDPHWHCTAAPTLHSALAPGGWATFPSVVDWSLGTPDVSGGTVYVPLAAVQLGTDDQKTFTVCQFTNWHVIFLCLVSTLHPQTGSTFTVDSVVYTVVNYPIPEVRMVHLALAPPYNLAGWNGVFSVKMPPLSR